MRGRGWRVALLGAAVAVASFGVAQGASSSSFSTPLYRGDFPDPAIITVNGSYWAYSTGSAGRNLQVMSSSDLRSWTTPTDPLPTLPNWASAGKTWAPGVIQLGRVFVMYYTVHAPALRDQCISVATAPTPAGPFVDPSSGPLVCQVSRGGSIDPNPYVDPGTGQLLLLWKSDDNSLGQPTHIWGQTLTPDGLSMAAGTTPALLLTMSAAWQVPSMEGPTIVRNGARYYLFYSANNFDTSRSGIGYAVASSALGTYANISVIGPWLGSRQNATGSQGPWVFRDLSGTSRLAFAAWDGKVGYENGGIRSLWAATLSFNFIGTPQLS